MTQKQLTDESKTPEPNETVLAEEPKAPEKSKPSRLDLPLLVEVALNFSYLFLFLMTAVVAATSYLAGASIPQVLLRAGVTLVIFGFLLTNLAERIAAGALDAAKAEIEAAASSAAAEDEATAAAAKTKTKSSEDITIEAMGAVSQEIRA